MDSRTLETLQGELERLFTLDQMRALSLDALGLDPQRLGKAETKGAYAKALLHYCQAQDALPALVDAMRWSTNESEQPLQADLGSFSNGELAPGTVLGSLRVLRKVGEGGLGIVYLAERQSDDRQERAAVKVIRPEYARNRAAVQRFSAASRWLRKLELKGLVPIQEIGELADARPWVAADYIESETLAERIRKHGAMHISTALPILRSVFAAVSELHQRGLVHGDLKAENIFIAEAAGRLPSGVLVDAGSDRLLVTEGPQDAAATGQLPVSGTPKALAPEQARGAAPDVGSEVYAAGVLVYETLCGVPPFRGDNAIDVIAGHLTQAPKPPSTVAAVGAVSPAVDAVVLQALSKRPEKRFSSIQQFAEALSRAAGRLTTKIPVSESTIEQTYHALLADPTSSDMAQQLEDLLASSGDLSRAAHMLTEVAETQKEGQDRSGLLLRAARLYAQELNNPGEAEQLYKEVLDDDLDNADALRGLTAVRRTLRDYTGLVDVLLERAHREGNPKERLALMREAAELHADKRADLRSASQLYGDILVEDPEDEDARRALLRLGLRDPTALTYPMNRLAEVASHLTRTLQSDQDEALKRATTDLLAAEGQQQELGEQLEAALNERRAEQDLLRQQLQIEVDKRRRDHTASLEYEREARENQLLALETERVALEEALRPHRALLEERGHTLEQTHAQAEAKVDAYEAQLEAIGDAPTREQAMELDRLGTQAEAAVDAAAALEQALEHARTQDQELSTRLRQLEEQTQSLSAAGSAHEEEISRLMETDMELHQLVERIERLDESDVELTPEESMHWHAVEAEVARNRALLEGLNQTLEEKASAAWQRTRKQAVTLRLLLGDLYLQRLKQPEMALLAYEEALALSPDNEDALTGLISLHERNHAWATLAELHLERAERAKSRVHARNCLLAAAQVSFNRLNDLDRSRTLLEEVIAEDPGDERAQSLLSEVMVQQQDYGSLAELLKQRIPNQQDSEQVDTRLTLAQLLDNLEDPLGATAQYREVLKLDPENREAIKQLRRLAEQLDDQPLLALALKAELSVAATPKRRILIWEQLARMQEEEFVDVDAAVGYYEKIADVNPRHRVAAAALARLYRQQGRHMDAVERLARSAELADDQAERVTLLHDAAQLLADHALDRDRAITLCEQVLEIADDRRETLLLLARLLLKDGQRRRAVATLDRLTERLPSGALRAEQLVRLAQLAEEADDEDGAVQRYKRAVEEDPSNRVARERLQAIYLQRGDAHGAAEMLRRALHFADSELEQARLHAALGSLFLNEFSDSEAAAEAFEAALALDGTNALATAGLGRIARLQGQHEDANGYFETALKRLGELPEEDAAEICLLCSDLHAEQEQWEEAIALVQRARAYAPEDRKIVQHLSDLLSKAGEPEDALATYEEYLAKWGSDLPTSELQRQLVRLSELQRVTERHDEALQTLRRALPLGYREEVFSALVDLLLETEAPSEAVELLQERLLKVHDPAGRHALLARIGDILAERAGDARGAAQHYSMALDERPRDRKLLSKLMNLFAELRDWPQLVELILRSAESVTNPAEIAKYYLTAASIARKELHRYDEAANYLSKAIAQLPFDEGEEHFEELSDCLTHNQDWERLERAYEKRVERFSNHPGIPASKLADLLNARADVLRNHLNRPNEAVIMMEEAQALAPQTPERRTALADLYARQPQRYLSKAVATHRENLGAQPLDLGTLRGLRRLYTSAKRPDESFCMCQALYALNAAAEDEQHFYEKYRLAGLPRYKHTLNDDLFRELVQHPTQDPLLTAIFATLTPAIVASQCSPHEVFGLTPERRVDLQSTRSPMGRVLAHAGHAMGQLLPPVFAFPEADNLLSFLFVSPPAIGLGQDLPANITQHALAFVAARHTSYYRPGHLPRQLSPTGTGLRAWLVASICMIIPGFAVPANMESQVNENLQAIRAHLTGPQRDTLCSLGQKLVDAAPELDLHQWMAGVDFTADRVGFILANDLLHVRDALELNPQGGGSPLRADRERELLSYATSDAYFELRKRLGIALGG